jgi:hypothetical protein
MAAGHLPHCQGPTSNPAQAQQAQAHQAQARQAQLQAQPQRRKQEEKSNANIFEPVTDRSVTGTPRGTKKNE